MVLLLARALAGEPAQPLDGDVPPDPEVDAVLVALAPALAACHASEETARWEVRLAVRADGAVAAVDFTGSPADACVRDALAGARLPARQGDYAVSRGLVIGPAGVTFSLPIVVGSLDKAHIDAVIKRNMAQVRYCYQRELTKDPGLAGKVVVKFVIAKDGTVSSATTKSSTMGNEEVERCINGRFMRFQFDEPSGGGIVIVSYPFIFMPSTETGVVTAHATFDPPPEGTPAGSLELARIDAVIERRGTLRALRRCHVTREASGRSGEIVVQLQIAVNGRVDSAVTRSTTMNAPEMEACVSRVVAGLRFPEPDGDGVVVVSYPLMFTRQ
ncbi:MAG: AgmX/PglI C-terminal domain-containing protein [Myxococcota bacterium]